METPHLPVISITFQQLAETIIARSARGTMFLVVKDTTQSMTTVAQALATFASMYQLNSWNDIPRITVR